MDTPLPEGWRWMTLVECATVIQGQSPPGDTYNTQGDGLPFFQGKAEFGDLYPTAVKWCSAPTKIAQPDDVLISVRAPVGPTNLATTECCIGRGLAAVRPLNGTPSRYLLYALRRFESDLASKATGSTFSAISGAQLRAQMIPLPPLPEQHRVVAAIETHLTRLDAAVAALERARARLKRYRAAVIKAACEGRLVPTEAALARTEGRPYEPAPALLARIQEARAVAKAPSERGPARSQPPPSPVATEVHPLPEGWAWVSAAELASPQPHALSIGPFGSSLKVSDYTTSGVPLVFVRNIRSERFGGEGAVYVSEPKAAELSAHRVWPGDVLITKMGSPPGDACIYPDGQPVAIITADCIRFNVAAQLALPQFVALAVNSEHGKGEIESATRGVAQQKVSLARFRGIRLPLPPLAEQERIVAEVERRLSVLDQLDAAVTTNLKRADSLRQSVLRRAFSGQLVDDELMAEPALTYSMRTVV